MLQLLILPSLSIRLSSSVHQLLPSTSFLNGLCDGLPAFSTWNREEELASARLQRAERRVDACSMALGTKHQELRCVSDAPDPSTASQELRSDLGCGRRAEEFVWMGEEDPMHV